MPATLSALDILATVCPHQLPSVVLDAWVTLARQAGLPAFRLGIAKDFDQDGDGQRLCGLVFVSGHVYTLYLLDTGYPLPVGGTVPIRIRPATELTRELYRFVSNDVEINLHVNSRLSAGEEAGIQQVFAAWFRGFVPADSPSRPFVEFLDDRDGVIVKLHVSELLLSAEAMATQAVDLLRTYFKEHPRRLWPYVVTAAGAYSTSRSWMPRHPTVSLGARLHF